ncbi:MAG TPA: hypothetical protein VFW24_13455 [Acidimicrobiales bacterium]|nr:hypothetical protein [Acidimicrobiales bacterium]
MRLRLGGRAGAAVIVAVGALGAGWGGFAPAAGAACASPGPADSVAPTQGTPQTTKIGTAFPQSLQVTVYDDGGCPISTPTSVTFTAPSTGASGIFQLSQTTTYTVGTQNGVASAGTFTANNTAGNYLVNATATVNGVTSTGSFNLTNTSAGVTANIIPTSGGNQTATVGSPYGGPLQAEVVDANGNPVQNVNVTFTVQAGSGGAGATFNPGGGTATEPTTSSGIATSPVLDANQVAGSFSASASTPGITGTAAYQLTNLASAPAAISPGSGSSQATPVNKPFPVPLSVTVTDAQKNPVTGASVSFRAPGHGASGTFAGGGTTVTVPTDSSGVAVAPTFTANGTPGGYIVTASVTGVSSAAAFSLVNQAPGAASTGYWLVSSDGGVFSYGTAGFFGSAGALHLRASIVGMASTPDGRGYWLVASDGGVFTYGDARFAGSAGSLPLSAPITGMAAAPDGAGYWLVAADGGVFGYGSAGFHGSAASSGDRLVRALAAGPGGAGYWLADAAGIVYGYGDAPVSGSPAGSGTVLASPIVGMTAPH